MTISLRPMLPTDLDALEELFRTSILLAEEDYSEEQMAAWADRADEPGFAKGLADGLTLLALRNGELAGYASLKKDAITMLYVLPHHARHRVATTLIDALERLAAARGIGLMTVDASETAYPLFLKRGYLAMQRNSVPIGDVWIANTTMVKKIEIPAVSSTLQ